MRHRSTRSSDHGKTDKNCERDKARSAGDKMLSRDPVSLSSDLENLTQAGYRVKSALYCFISYENPQVGIACHGVVSGCGSGNV